MEKKQDLFTTYEVDERGYMQNEQGKAVSAVLEGMKIPKGLRDTAEYISSSSPIWPIRGIHRIITYYAPGANEGWYAHIDAIRTNGQVTTLVVAKFLTGKESAKSLCDFFWEKLYG